MKQLFALLFCIGIFYYSNAQNTATTFEEVVKLYSKNVYKNDSIALTYAHQAKNIAITNDNPQQKTKAYYYIATILNRLDENKNALETIELAIVNSSSLKDIKHVYNCFLNKGHMLSELGEDSKALKSYLNALNYAKDIDDVMYEVAALANIAYLKKIHKDFDEAISTYKTILKQLAPLENSRNKQVYRLSALMNIADAYLWVKNPDQAEVYNQEALNDCCDEYIKWIQIPLRMNKAIIHYQRAQYDDCIEISKQIRDVTKKNPKKAQYLTSLFYLGKSAFRLENYQEAIAYLEETLAIINTSATVDINEKELHEFLAHLYIKVGNSEKNLFHFQKYAALEKKESAEDLKINNETHKLVDSDRLQNEIDEIKNDLTAQTHKKRNILIAAIVLFILLVGSIVYYKRKEKIAQQKFQDLLKKVENLEKKETATKSISKKEKVTDEKANAILEKIADFEKKEYYLLLECSLGFMAEKLETNTSYLSKVINKYKKKSFTSYISELRINTALVRLKNDTTLQSYTIKAIAEEFGFKRQETFSKAFKAQTGIYPSQYLKNLRK